MKDRIKQILKTKSITSSQLAADLNVQPSGISHILSGRNKPSLDFVVRLINLFPELNELWLLKGEGAMYKAKGSKEKSAEGKSIANTILNDEDQVPYGHFKYKDSVEKESLEVDKIEKVTIVKLVAIYSDNSFEIFNSKK
jgi:plasmid maintenance system antidote protein VapI